MIDTGTTELDTLGLRWDPSGQASMTGPLLELATALDTAFTAVAELWAAEHEQHPATLAAATLDSLGYLRSFAHQTTFAVGLESQDTNIDEFTRAPVRGDGTVRATRLAPITAVLTPAACYHVFAGRRGDQLPGATYVTTRNTCFRRETHFRPLRRQFSFTMREIVCLGNDSDVQQYTEQVTETVTALAAALGLPITWQHASDPFFRPESDPRAVLQRVHPSKREAMHQDLALGSINHHFEHFGELMGISRDGAPAHSACMAFGIERWLAAVLDAHGHHPDAWPDVPAAVRAVCETSPR